MPTNKELIEKVASKMQVLPSVPTLYLDLLDDDRNAAMLLNQIVYWCNIKGGDWFYKTYENWQTELRLSEYQVKNAINKLKAHGVQVDFRKVGKTPKLHYRVDFGQLENSLVNFLHSQKVRQSNNLTVKKLDSQETCTSIEVQETLPSEVKETCTSINTEITNSEITKDYSGGSTTHPQEYGTTPVTPNIPDTTTTTEPTDIREFRKQHKANSPYKNAYQAAESITGTLSQYLSDMVKDLVGEYGEEDFIIACQEAELNNKRNLSYVKGILRKCKEEGRKPGQKRQTQQTNQATYTNTGNSNGYGGYRKQYQEPRKLSVQEEIALHVPQHLKSARQLEWERQQQEIKAV